MSIEYLQKPTQVDSYVNGIYTFSSMAEDSTMTSVRRLFKKSGLTLHELGLKMGYEDKIARQSAFQFMKASDPRISMLRRFARALDVSLDDLIAEPKKKKNDH